MTPLLQWWEGLFTAGDAPAHSVCLSAAPNLIWLHAVSDGLIALAYYSIPFALLYFTWRRRDLTFRWMFVLFGLFILACGTSHVMHMWNLWEPQYEIEGLVKAVTAVVSVATAILLWPLIPRALALPSPAQLERVNLALNREVIERQVAEQQVRAANAELERRVAERTAELEKLNAELRLAKEMAERANVAKTRFLAAASHDLRQPAQALTSYFAVLRARAIDADVQDVLKHVDTSLDALNMLLAALLDVSKLDAGIIRPEPQAIHCGELLDRVTNDFIPVAQGKGVDLVVVPCGSAVRSDPVLLGRILQNLLQNALRYTQTGRVLVGCRRRGDTLAFEVWDTGIGIPEDRLSDIFEEFTQVGNAERDRSQGLGLGLAIVNRLAHLLGHPIEVRSVLGKGSVFRVVVPLADQPASRPSMSA